MLPARSPLVVAGMHRSGTSLAASLLAAAGVEMGPDIPADDGNVSGYLEDREFLALNREILASATGTGVGHRDWGWVESEVLDTSRLAEFVPAAGCLVGSRQGAGGRWGFKDPRSTLLLDFWDGVCDEARYLLVYRYPWDVADSMQRIPADLFRRNPSWAYRIWSFYNERLLQFARRNRERCLLVCVDAAIRQPELFGSMLRDRLGVRLETQLFEETLDPARFRTVEGSDPLIGLVSEVFPECVTLLRELDEAADLGASGLWAVTAEARRPETPTPVDLSVVIPCFNDGPLLIEAVASFARCAPPASEAIVVDDGSDDPETLEILNILARVGYRVVRQPNRGLSAARNLGFEEAAGRYVVPLDADNRLVPGFLETAIGVLDESPELGVVHGDWREFGDRNGYCEIGDFDLRKMTEGGNYIDACAVIREAAWRDLGGYDAELRHMEDWEFWIRMGKRGWGFRHLPQLAFEYRVRPDSLTFGDRRAFADALDHCLRKHPEISSPRWRLRKLGLRYAGLRDRLLPPETQRRRSLGRAMNHMLGR